MSERTEQLEAEVERLRDELAAVTGEAAWRDQELLHELLIEARRVEGELSPGSRWHDPLLALGFQLARSDVAGGSSTVAEFDAFSRRTR